MSCAVFVFTEGESRGQGKEEQRGKGGECSGSPSPSFLEKLHSG